MADAANKRFDTAPPPTRGWTRAPFPATKSRSGSPAYAGMGTLSLSLRTALVSGSPAYAGMDLSSPGSIPLARWLPRLRGDGP